MSVFLVGAGPGDPGLLTVRARELLACADVVAYDELCSDALLACAGPHAELLSVGRRGHDSPKALYRLHPLVLERARAGKTIVRLKAGDPFIFGRGGEEAEELLEAGIPYEIVPGVSSALGAAAYSGIPLTHRGVSSSVTFSTGHDLSASDGGGTLVLFMAARKLQENLARLVANGRDPATPAAYVSAATTPRQQILVGTIGDLSVTPGDDPALVIVGDVVSLRAKLAWIEKRPLHGKRILVGRARSSPSEIAARLRALGAEVFEAPEIGIAPPSSFQPLERALIELGGYSCVVFGSDEAVTRSFARLGRMGLDLRQLPKVPFVAAGRQSASALRERGVCAEFELDGACADAVKKAKLPRGRALLIADEAGRPQLAAQLGEVHAVAAYRTTRRFPPLRWENFDLVIAPSSSAAQHLAEIPALANHQWLAMGPISESAVRATRVTRADRDDLDSLVQKAEELLR